MKQKILQVSINRNPKFVNHNDTINLKLTLIEWQPAEENENADHHSRLLETIELDLKKDVVREIFKAITT